MFFLLPNVQRLNVHGRRPSLPPGVRIYAIGDIHGRIDLLDELFIRIETDIAAHPSISPAFVFLGDYIDRGASSRETINRLIAWGEIYHSIFLKGNHELLLLQCLDDSRFFDRWMRLGGLQTMMSYDVATDLMRGDVDKLQQFLRSALPDTHLRFFRNLQGSFSCGDFFFAHAGVKPAIGLEQQREEDLLWIRKEFFSCNEDFGKIVVHGHTPALQIEVQSNRINIDTGAYATNCLTCLVIQDNVLSVIDTIDRVFDHQY